VRLLEQVKSGEQKRQQEQMAAAELAKKKSEAAALLSEARSLFSGKDYEGAKQKISGALVLVPGDSAAAGLKAEVEAAEEQSMQQMAARKAAGNDFNTAQIGDTRVVDVGSGVKLTLCYIPPGSFTMGSPASEANRSDDEDQVQVRISKGFWLAKTECTQAQWRAVMGAEPSHFKGDDLPVESVSWEDAQAFMAKLNGKNVLPAGWKWSLPSEAQWEYACRAGTMTATSYGDSLSSMQANFDGNEPYGSASKGPYLEKTSPVGSYAANAWGLQDMHGNVSEWCSDWYADKLPGGTDPMGAFSGTHRVGRGGSWNFRGLNCRSAGRDWLDTGFGNDSGGFRCALVVAGNDVSVRGGDHGKTTTTDSIEGARSNAQTEFFLAGTVSVPEGDTLSVRSAPGMDYPVMSKLNDGTVVLIMGRPVTNGTTEWVQVAFEGDFNSGWAASKYLVQWIIDKNDKRFPKLENMEKIAPLETAEGSMEKAIEDFWQRVEDHDTLEEPKMLGKLQEEGVVVMPSGRKYTSIKEDILVDGQPSGESTTTFTLPNGQKITAETQKSGFGPAFVNQEETIVGTVLTASTQSGDLHIFTTQEEGYIEVPDANQKIQRLLEEADAPFDAAVLRIWGLEGRRFKLLSVQYGLGNHSWLFEVEVSSDGTLSLPGRASKDMSGLRSRKNTN
jgi:formylglycine-generating enzyme required for sulfatase activity/uncharacterized protein YgiM (DUF1202 family)